MASLASTRASALRFASRAVDRHPRLRGLADRYLLMQGRNARIRFYGQFIRVGDVVFDVGANIGTRTDAFVALGATVVAVEPQERCQAQLRRRYAAQDRVHLVPAALGSEDGEHELYVSSAHALTSMSSEWIEATRSSGRFADYSWAEARTVSVTTLDRLIDEFGTPSYCKIDVEGFEVEVLRGLTRPIGMVSFEFTPELIERAHEALDLLVALGAMEFNLSIGESYAFDRDVWMNADELRRALAETVDRNDFADVFARLES